MNNENNKSILVIVALVTVLILVVALISAFWPKYEMQFIEFGLLGKDKIADNYFLYDNSTVSTDSQVDWYLYIHNHMGTSQDVIVKVKLLNSEMEVPNDQEHEPSPYTPFIELPFSLLNNDTLLVPFSWSITETILQDASILLKQLKVNDQSIEVDVSTFSYSFFRMVFELWVYDPVSQQYEFGWRSTEAFSSSSLHIGFRVNLDLE